MARYCIDCRDFPSNIKRTVALFADTKEALLEAAMEHAVRARVCEDVPAVRAELEEAFKQGMRRE